MPPNSPFQLRHRGKRNLAMKVLEYIVGLRHLDRLYQRSIAGKPVDGEPRLAFVTKVLKVLGIRYQTDGAPPETIPASGSLLMVANHPLGGAEGLALMEVLLRVRPDVKVLTNQFLSGLTELKDVFIGVDILGIESRTERKAANKAALAAAVQWVKNGGALLVFPAGEVAGWNWKTGLPKEAPWRHTAGKILKETGAAFLPVYVQGKNSRLFYGLGMIHPLCRSVWLVRELINAKNQQIILHIGKVEDPSAFTALAVGRLLTNALRMRTFLLSRDAPDIQEASSVNTSAAPRSAEISVPIATEKLEADRLQLDPGQCLLKNGDYEVWCTDAKSIPNILQEIGRLRELTFCAAGEGTGNAIDLDRFDEHYQHLFIWNCEKSEIVGAYRLGQTDKLVARAGIKALYTRSLFRYDQRLLDKLGPALEMGRSFVRPEYQKSLLALLLLWKGIGRWVSDNPQYRILFGPVSISHEYKSLSRYLIAMTLEQNSSGKELAALVQPLQPLPQVRKLPWNRDMLAGLGDVRQLSALVKLVEQDRDIPILLKQYLKLNGFFVGFNVDRAFSNALDGLIIVDLLKSDKKSVMRYLGAEGYDRLHRYHSEPVEEQLALE